MRFQTDLVPATLIRRYKRFLADVTLADGQVMTVHCPNPGAMTGLAEPGLRVWLEPNDDPKKKLGAGWRLSELGDGHFAGIDAGRANAVVAEALLAGKLPGLSRHNDIRAEVPYGTGSRVDFLASSVGQTDVYIEVKSVTLMRQPGLAEFPDTVTKRGAKHLAELAKIAQGGSRAVLLYLVQRTDCTRIALAADIDPGYAQAAALARAAGVEMMAFGTRISPEGIEFDAAIPFS